MLQSVSVSMVAVLVGVAALLAQPRQIPRSPRLYVSDCGTLDVADTGRFRLKREEVATDKLSVGCYLIAHPRGTLISDGALSHYHYDHSANTNDFAKSTWLVRQVERDAMFAAKPPDLVQPSTYSAMRTLGFFTDLSTPVEG